MADKVRIRSYFVYPIPAVINLTAGSSTTSTLRIESATNFYWIKSMFWAENNAAVGGQTQSTRVLPSVDVNIQTSGADRNLFNAFVPIASVFGTGEIPSVLPMPMMLPASSELRVDFRSRESALAVDLYLAIAGWKDYGEMAVPAQPAAA